MPAIGRMQPLIFARLFYVPYKGYSTLTRGYSCFKVKHSREHLELKLSR